MNAKPDFLTTLDEIWQASAPGLAIVSGVFLAIVSIVLTITYLQEQSTLPDKERIYSEAMATAQLQLAQDPSNEALKQSIRDMDLALRQTFFEQRALVEAGRWLAVAGAFIFLISLKKTMALYRFRKKRSPKNRNPEREALRLSQARKAVLATGLVLIAALGSLALTPGVDLPGTSGEMLAEAGPAYPSPEEIEANWPQFRGPYGHGTAFAEDIPLTWDGETGEGIAWEVEVPLPGANSPIVWGNRLFVSGANEEEKAVFCYDVATGQLLWRGDVTLKPNLGPDEELRVYVGTGWAASTMATDGNRVFAIFADGVLAAFDMDGTPAWSKNMGVPDSVYNFATSLMCYQDRLILQFDQGLPDDGISFLYAFDSATGNVVYQTPRPVGNSWTSPIVIFPPSGPQIITVSEPWVMGHEADSGVELWRADLLGTDLAPSAVFDSGHVIAIQPNETMYAIRPDGHGDVTESHVVYDVNCFAPDVTSPVVRDGLVFLQTTMGIMVCHDIVTGEELWDHDLDDSFQPSPLIAGEWIYTMSETGQMYRVKASREFETAETLGFIDEWFRATPAIVNGRIFLRSEEKLYCIASDGE